jgi:hypothetical protein
MTHAPMIDHLSPRECEELERAERSGLDWPRVIRSGFLDGTRLLLGSDRARTEREIEVAAGIEPDSVRRAIEEAARWCGEHGLHLLGYTTEGGGDGWRHFLAVG